MREDTVKRREMRGYVELAISSAKIWNTPLGVVIFLTCIFNVSQAADWLGTHRLSHFFYLTR